MLKIGAVSYVNALPFFYDLTGFQDTQFIFDHPTKINALLQEGIIDVGLISSESYLQNRETYELLSDVGIGASRQVMSVSLFTKFPIQALTNKKIALPTTSATSTQLLQILCHSFWKATPQFITFDGTPTQQLEDTSDGHLLIGDSCLQYNPAPHYEKIDLATEWYTQTQLPFIFALFASRKELYKEKFDSIHNFMNQLKIGISDLQKVLAAAEQRVSLPASLLTRYFQTIDYQLTIAHYRGLNLFDTLRHADATV